MKTTLILLCAFLLHSPASAASIAREGSVLPSRRMESTDSEVPRLLGPVDRLVVQADARVAKGLAARSSSQSIAAFRHAERMYVDALRRIDRIASQHAGDPSLIDALSALHSRAQDEAVQAAIDAGHIYLARADFQDALKEADKAVSIDPEDSAALEFRDTTTLPNTSLLGVIPLRSGLIVARPALQAHTR
jgi:tetratricopeptide (TPR) repeat protein